MASSRSALHDALWIVALSTLSIAAHGHNFGVGNHTGYLMWIERLRDPSFLANDWYMSTPMLQPNVVRPLRHLADWLGDANGFLLALLITRIVLVGGVWTLTRAYGGGRLAAGLAVTLVILAPRVSLGAHYPSGSYFEASHLGAALSALSLALLARRRHTAAGVVAGLAGHFHLFFGAHLGAIATLAILLDGKGNGSRFGRWLRFAIPTFLLAGYSIYQAGSGYFGTEAESPLTGRDIVEILCFRHPHHHSPLSWPLLPSVLFLAYIVVGAALSIRIRKRGTSPIFEAVYLYGLFSMIVGTVFVEWIPVSLVALFQFFRVTLLTMVWTAIAVALWLEPPITGELRGRRPLAAAPALACAAAFRIPKIFLPLAAIVWGMNRLIRRPSTAGSSPTGGDSGALGERGSRPRPPFSSDLLPPAIAALAGVVLLLLGAAGQLNPLVARAGRPDHFRLRAESATPGMRALCDWVRNNTPTNAIFLEPPGLEGFQLYARRADVANFKQMTFTSPAMWQWFERIARIANWGRLLSDTSDEAVPSQALDSLHRFRRDFARDGLTPDRFLDDGFLSLSAGEILGLSRRYGATYVIRPAVSPERDGGGQRFETVATVGGFVVDHILPDASRPGR